MDVSPPGYGTVLVDGLALDSYPLSLQFESGEAVSLEAVPAPGYRFDGWSRDLSGTANPASVVIDCNKAITATFSKLMYTLTVQSTGGGATSPRGTHDYNRDTVVSINASPADGWQFDGWTGDVADTGSANTTVTMDSDKTVTAAFSQEPLVGWPWLIGIAGGLMVMALAFVVLLLRRRAY